MIPQEVKELIKKLVKDEIEQQTQSIIQELGRTNAKINNLEKEILIHKEGDNI